MKTKRIGKYWKILLTMIGITVILNLLGFSTAFCDFYADHIYIGINALFGILTSWCPFAVGEILMYLGILMVLTQLFIGLLVLILRRKQSFVSFAVGYSKTVLMTIGVLLLIYTTNWLIPFRASVLRVSDNERVAFTVEEVAYVRNLAVNEINRLADQANRDEDGNLIYDYTQEDIKTAMKAQEGSYPRLSGFYPNLKENLCSPFLDWMGIGGYNYIYTMEPSYSRYITQIYKPALWAHEMAHNKGYYKENEGEFISCITMINSDNPLLQYSGYTEIYSYINDDFVSALYDAMFELDHVLTKEEVQSFKAVYQQYPQLSSRVKEDYEYARQLKEALYEKEVSTKAEETFSGPAKQVGNVGWDIQADILKENTYEGVVLMLLRYFIPE